MGVMDKFRAMGEPRQAAADPAISDGLFFRSRNKSRADAVMKIRTLIAVAVVVAGGGMSGAEAKSTLRTDGGRGMVKRRRSMSGLPLTEGILIHLPFPGF